MTLKKLNALIAKGTLTNNFEVTATKIEKDKYTLCLFHLDKEKGKTLVVSVNSKRKKQPLGKTIQAFYEYIIGMGVNFLKIRRDSRERWRDFYKKHK